jgi:hypothetical protein
MRAGTQPVPFPLRRQPRVAGKAETRLVEVVVVAPPAGSVLVGTEDVVGDVLDVLDVLDVVEADLDLDLVAFVPGAVVVVVVPVELELPPGVVPNRACAACSCCSMAWRSDPKVAKLPDFSAESAFW